ncbi:MAG: hypothetical protein EBR34_11875 [Sphingomonadaceae bacterium]|nr:hypothetical protein [Sphingomonadaceae bacterium]
MLLLLDMTFRTAEGGALMNAFRDRWAKNFELDDDKFDEPEAFDHLLDEVGSLADASVEYAIEGGPGMTSEYGAYFCSSSERMITAVRKFENETNR